MLNDIDKPHKHIKLSILNRGDIAPNRVEIDCWK